MNITCFIAWTLYWDWLLISQRMILHSWWMHGMMSSRNTCYIQRTFVTNIWWAILNGAPRSVYGWTVNGSYIKCVYGCLGLVVLIHKTCFESASNCTSWIPKHPRLVLYVLRSWLQIRKLNVSQKMLLHSDASTFLTSYKTPQNRTTWSEPKQY